MCAKHAVLIIFTLVASVFVNTQSIFAQNTDTRTGTRGYILTTVFSGNIPVIVNFTNGVVSGEYFSNSRVINERNPGRQEWKDTNGIVEGEYRNGIAVITLREINVRKVTDSCGSFTIKNFAEYTFSGVIAENGAMTPTGSVSTRYRLDPAMVGVAKKFEGQNVPPTYNLQCGNQLSGFSFSDKDIMWKSSALPEKSGQWSARVCGLHEKLSGVSCVCKPGEEKECTADKEKLNTIIAPISVSRTGEGVTYRKQGQGEDLPLTKDTVLKPGDTVYALLDSVELKIGGHLLTVYAPSSFQLDEASLTPEKIQKTRVTLFSGVIKSKIPIRSAPRSDFHVATPGANSSIRASEMVVRYEEESNITTVYVTEDEATVQGVNDASPVTVSEGSKLGVGKDQKTGVIEDFVASELPIDSEFFPRSGITSSWIWYILGGGAIVIAALVFFFKR